MNINSGQGISNHVLFAHQNYKVFSGQGRRNLDHYIQIVPARIAAGPAYQTQSFFA